MKKSRPDRAAVPALVPVRDMPEYRRGLEHRTRLADKLASLQADLAAAQRRAVSTRAALHDAEKAEWTGDADAAAVTDARQVADGADQAIQDLARQCDLGAQALRDVDARLGELERELVPVFQERWEAAFRPLAEEFGQFMRDRGIALMEQMQALWELDGAPCRRAGHAITNPPAPMLELFVSENPQSEHFYSALAQWLRTGRAHGYDM